MPQEKSAKEKTSAKKRPDKLKQPEVRPFELELCQVLGPPPALTVSSSPVTAWSPPNSLATPVGCPPLLPLQAPLSWGPTFVSKSQFFYGPGHLRQLSQHAQYCMSNPSVTSAPSFLLTFSFSSYLDRWETCWQCPPQPPLPPLCSANGRGGLCKRLHPNPRPFFP